MPLLRILVGAALGILLMLGALWSMNINYAAWMGAWLSPERMYPAGFAVIVVFGVVCAYLYAHYIGNRFTGPAAVRGAVFGLVLSTVAIWVAPFVLDGLASAIGNTQVVYGGRGIHDSRPKADEQLAEEINRVPDCPPLAGVEPPFASMTASTPWMAAGDWQGRVIPFALAFLLYGLVVGGLLSEKVGPSRK